MFLLQLSCLTKREDLQYVCELFHQVTNLQIWVTNRDGEKVFQMDKEQGSNPLYSDIVQFPVDFPDLPQTDAVPCFFTTPYMENFFSVALIQQNVCMGRVIAGPILLNAIDRVMLDRLFLEMNIPLRMKEDLMDYYQTLPMMDYNKMLSASMLLYYAVYHHKIDSTAILEKNVVFNKENRRIETEISSELLKNRQYPVYHHTPFYEKYLLHCVKEGDKEGLLGHMGKYPGGEPGVLSRDPLRSQKNLFICSVTLISRAAMEGGLDAEQAFTLSDSYIQWAEELRESSEVVSLHFKMIFDFTDRVRSVKEQNHSRLVTICCNYINQHLYEHITLTELSCAAGVSVNYLSERFKKEAGISITAYIQKERVEEAKKLLILTDRSIMDICVSLNFSDQSYFTKIFKKFSNMTPKQYRTRKNGVDFL